MTANYKTFGGNPHESAEQEPEPEQQSEQSESEQQPESEPESEQPEQPLNTKTDTQPRVRFFCVHTHKLGFIVLAHEMQNAERKVQNWDLSYCLVVVASFPIPCHCEAAFAAVAISRYNLATIIALKIEVSDKMCYTSNIFRHPAFYQEIATSLRSSQ